MEQLRVLVSDTLAEAGLDILREADDVVVDVKVGLKSAELAELIGDYDALVIRSGSKVTAEVIERADRLKVIGRAGVGVDNVDVPAATKRGIIVMNAPGGNTIATAEHTLSLILASARNIPLANQCVKSGQWDRKRFTGSELCGKTLGIIGLGRIGTEVAKRAKGFLMRVVAYDPLLTQDSASKLDVELVPLDDLIRRADIITLHVPLTDETRHIIGPKQFAMMRKGVRIVNCSRGGVVDEAALAEAIKAGKVAGAALDVFEEEPPHSSPVIGLDQVVVTPHLAASTDEAQVNVAIDIAKQVLEAIRGGTVRNAVNFPSVDREMMLRLRPFIDIGEKLGLFLARFCRGSAQEVSIQYSGEILSYDLKPITTSFLKGYLEPALCRGVNYVNAPLLARERGIRITESTLSQVEDYANLIQAEVVTDHERHQIAGTLFGKEDKRIVFFDGYRVNAVPEGILLVCLNEDKPKIIGNIGTLLGEHGINIAGMYLGRKAKGGNAVTILNVDEPISTELLDKIESLPNILEARVVSLLPAQDNRNRDA